MEEKLKDVILTRIGAAKYLGMSERHLSRMIKSRLVPFIRIFYSEDALRGRILFSQKKLDAWERRSDEIVKEFPKDRGTWLMVFGEVIEAEQSEKVLSLKVVELSGSLIPIINRLEDTGLTEQEREELNKEFSEKFEGLQDNLITLELKEKERLRKYFGDETALRFFSKTFADELKAEKKTEAEKPKEMSGGIPIERFETYPGTKKPREQQQVTTIEQADNYEVITGKE